MSLKTSFFNKSIFRTDIKRFWWISLLETLILIIACVVPFYDRCMSYSDFYSYAPTLRNFDGFPFYLVFGIAISALLMSYIQSSAPMSGMHCLPLTRKTLLSSKLLSGTVLALIPILINGFILMALLSNPAIRSYCRITDILLWMFTGVIYSLLIITLTAFVNMMTGNTVGTLVFTVGFMVLPGALESLFTEVFDETVYGFINETSYLSRYLYLDADALIIFPSCFIYPALIAIFIIGAHLLYKSRNLESFGEVIAFRWLKPVFIGIISTFTSLFGFFYFWEITDKSLLIWLIPFGIVGTVIAQMISRKSLKLRGMWKPVLIYIAAAVCFIGAVRFDLTGYERRIPKLEEIDCAKITYDYDYSNMVGRISPYFTEAEDIKNVIDLHSHLIKNRHKKHENNTVRIPIEYRLKSGKVFIRTYNVSFFKDAAFLKPLYETRQLKASEFPIVNGAEKDYVRITISTSDQTQNVTEIYPSNENFNNILKSLETDIMKFTYEDYILASKDNFIKLNAYYVPKGTNSSKLTGMDELYLISSKFTNTISALKEIGIAIE